MAEAKGKTLTGLIRFLRAQQPDGGLARLLEACPAVAPIYSQRINGLLWYPIEALVDPMEKMVEMFSLGDEKGYTDFGRWGAQLDAQRNYGVILSGSVNIHPLDLIKCCDFLWIDNYRNAGEMKAVEITDSTCVVDLRGFDGIRHSHCRMLEGWIDESVKSVMERFDTKVELESCVHQGRQSNRFACRWAGRAA